MPKLDISLTIEEIKYYYSLLEEEITDYDCGELCKPYNQGVPYCCSTDNAVPLLYKAEYDYLRSIGDQWKKWYPKTKEDHKLKKQETKDQIFCECKGHLHCIRSQRSISCRTFPLEPYLDRRGVFVGLTFIKAFTEKDEKTGKVKCPLTQRYKDIRQEFIDSHFIFWEKILLRREEEYETYLQTSKELRKEFRKTGKKFVVLFPSHLKDSKIIPKYLY
ncbi:MAG: hypothetical protein NZ853_10090 [Leptospiraceae bacterium]|nr:hypothetical protein [Leptospiraceae bacterium]MDW7974994.1 hypothetical protein [Leptospiraceae bacterium]